MENIYHLTDQATIEEEARQWVIRLDSDIHPSQDDISALRQWSQRSPRHKAELMRISEVWDDGNLLAESPAADAKQAEGFFSGLSRRIKLPETPRWLMFPAAALVLMGFFVLLSPYLMNSGQPDHLVYTTSIGEQLTKTLADGSTIQLNTNTELQVELDNKLRKIVLVRGEAHFDVTQDSARPFEVHAGRGIVRAIGTAFSVSLEQRDVEVTVAEGVVALATIVETTTLEESASGTPKSPLKTTTAQRKPPKNQELKQLGLLEAGQTATFSGVVKEKQHLADSELQRALAWRSGILAFSNTPLTEVIAEVSRYSRLTIEIADPELEAYQIGGRFKVGEIEALFDALEVSFGVEVNRLNEHHIQLLLASK